MLPTIWPVIHWVNNSADSSRTYTMFCYRRLHSALFPSSSLDWHFLCLLSDLWRHMSWSQRNTSFWHWMPRWKLFDSQYMLCKGINYSWREKLLKHSSGKALIKKYIYILLRKHLPSQVIKTPRILNSNLLSLNGAEGLGTGFMSSRNYSLKSNDGVERISKAWCCSTNICKWKTTIM